jgi:hypothetical protein
MPTLRSAATVFTQRSTVTTSLHALRQEYSITRSPRPSPLPPRQPPSKHARPSEPATVPRSRLRTTIAGHDHRRSSRARRHACWTDPTLPAIAEEWGLSVFRP